MGRQLPPLKALPAFEVAADRLSFSAAAQDLHVTHGAISRQVKLLEDHLGVALFRRFNRRIELTEAGLALLPFVRQALHRLETGATQVAVRSRQGPLIVSCLATFMMRWLIPRLYDFSAAHAGVEVRLRLRMLRSTLRATISMSRSGSASHPGPAGSVRIRSCKIGWALFARRPGWRQIC